METTTSRDEAIYQTYRTAAQEGYARGFNAGRERGRADGYADGARDGWAQGKQEGRISYLNQVADWLTEHGYGRLVDELPPA